MRFRIVGVVTGAFCLLLLATSAMAQGGEFLGAEWGTPAHKVDVTSRVRTFIHDGVLQLEVTRFNLGVDPAPHENKVLVIRLRERDGDIKSYSYPERSMARLELHPEWQERREQQERHDDAEHREDYREHHDEAERREDGGERHERGLQILRAEYGVEGQFANVTEALRNRIDDGRLFLFVNNFTMGVDPAPGLHKHLRVLYVQDGERRHTEVDEKTELRLPQ
jgi:DnaJ-like protein C11, C-terminal